MRVNDPGLLTGWLAWLGSSVLLMLPAAAVSRRFSHGWVELRAAISLLVWIGLVMVGMLCLGMAQAFSIGPVFGYALTCGALGGIALWRGPAPDRSVERLPWIWLLLLPVFARTVFHAWLFAPYVWDTLSYHLVSVAEWVRHGGFVKFDTAASTAYFPAGFGLLQTWQVVFTHHDGLVELAGVPFYALGLLAVAILARNFGLNRREAAWTGVVAGYTPCLIQHTASGNNDIALAALILLIIAMITIPNNRWMAVRSACAIFCFFVGMSIKPYVAFALPGLILLLFVEGRYRGHTWWSCIWRWLPRGHQGWALFATGLFIGTFFYIRNYLWFENPLYPAIMGPGSTGDLHTGGGLAPMLTSLHLLVTEKIWDRGRFYPDLAQMAGWGWTVMSFGLASFFLLLVKGTPRLRFLILAAFLSICGIFYSVWPDNTNGRFLLWVPGLITVLTAVCVKRLPPGSLRWCTGVLTLTVMLNFVSVIDIGRLKPVHWKLMAWTPFHARSAAGMTAFSGKEFTDILAGTEKGDRIYFVGGSFCNIYPVYGADFSREIVFRNSARHGALVEELRRQDIRHLYVVQREEMRSTEYEEVMAAIEAGPFQHVRGGYYVLP